MKNSNLTKSILAMMGMLARIDRTWFLPDFEEVK